MNSSRRGSFQTPAAARCRVSLTTALLIILLAALLLLYIPLLITSSASTPIAPPHASPHNNQDVEDRLRYVETKLNAFLAFGLDPFLGLQKTPAKSKCRKQSDLSDLACGKNVTCHMDHRQVCLDDLLPKSKQQHKPCIVYDFGIREQPEFGAVLASDTFECQVFAFDPSPITKKWYATSELRSNPRYTLFEYGAGGQDEDLTLLEYNWGQISILKYPHRVVNPTDCNADGQCKYRKFDLQKEFTVPVKKLSTIMKDLGHDRIDVLKLDVEGSEYRFLEAMIDDMSCQAVDQLTLEWHHYDYDRRYGVTSAPHINMLVALLKERCGLEQFWVHSSGGWPSNLKLYADMGLQVFYNEASFLRVRQ